MYQLVPLAMPLNHVAAQSTHAPHPYVAPRHNAGGMFKFPQWNLGPLNAYGRALGAGTTLLGIFKKDVTAGRAKLARGEEVPGQLGVMLAAMPQSPETDE